MKRTMKKQIVCGILLFALSLSTFAQSRIATVDLRKLFDNYWKTKQADAALKDRASDMDKTHKEMLDGYQKSKEAYAKLLTAANDQAVSAAEREKRKKAHEDKAKQIKESEDTIKQFEIQARTTLDEQRKRMRDNILVEIRRELNAKAKSAGYNLVYDTAAESVNNTPVILYSTDENDLTDAVLSQLNASAPVDATPPPVKPAPKEDKKK